MKKAAKALARVRVLARRRPPASPAPSGRRAVETQLRKAAAWIGQGYTRHALPWHEFRYEHLIAIRTKAQQEGAAPASINLLLAALRRVMREAFNLGLIDARALARALAVRNVKGSREPAGRRISGGELGAILAGLALDRSAGARDAAMIALAYAGGLRRSELAALRLDNLQDKGKEGFELRLVGKGDKERVLFVNGGAAEALRDYLAARGREAGPLFYASRKAGTLLVGRCMNPRPSTTCCATGPSGPVWSSRPTTCGGAS